MVFPKKVNETRYPKLNSLSPTAHTWISHDGKPKPFLGHFIAKVQYATLPRSYPVCFYVFQDATSPQILLSYATLERLGILEFKVPNLVAQSQIDTLSIPSSPAPGSLRKTTKHVTFCDPLIDLDQPCSTPHTQGLSGLRKTTSLKVSFQEPSSTINGIKHKALPSLCPSPYHPIPALKQHILYNPNLKTKSALKVKLTKVTSPCTTTTVQDIITLK